MLLYHGICDSIDYTASSLAVINLSRPRVCVIWRERKSFPCGLRGGVSRGCEYVRDGGVRLGKSVSIIDLAQCQAGVCWRGGE